MDIRLRVRIESVWFAIWMYIMIESDEVQIIGEHVPVGKPHVVKKSTV